MIVNKDQIISEFKLKASGTKGWMVSSKNTDLKCPKCHNSNGTKLAFAFGEKANTFKCIKCSYFCRLESYLWKIGRKDLLKQYRDIKQEDILEKKKLISSFLKDVQIEPLPQCSLPLLFKRTFNSDYLNSRGCISEIYNNWTIGIAGFDLEKYVIFIIKEQDIVVGWVARSILSKETIDKLNENKEKYILRWRNSTSSDFSKIVFGLDEITEETESVIIVEGISSKMNVDIQLELYKDNLTKCVCTFGKKISNIQIKKIYEKGPSIEQVILFYDVDAVNAMKQFVFDIQKVFSNTKIAFNAIKDNKGEYKDAGDMNLSELEETFSKLQTPFEFWNHQLPKKSLI